LFADHFIMELCPLAIGLHNPLSCSSSRLPAIDELMTIQCPPWTHFHSVSILHDRPYNLKSTFASMVPE
jgi:hypothetical protein